MMTVIQHELAEVTIFSFKHVTLLCFYNTTQAAPVLDSVLFPFASILQLQVTFTLPCL